MARFNSSPKVHSPRQHVPPAIAFAIALVASVLTAAEGTAQLSVEGRWTTIPNSVADSSWDILSGLRGRGTHMALLRDSSNTAWVIHWHLGEKARIWKALPNRDTCPAFDVPLGVDTSQVFCSGHSIMADGRLLVVGGVLNVDQDNIGATGTKNAVVYDPTTRHWSTRDSMTYERWYPTSVSAGCRSPLIANEEVLQTPSSLYLRDGYQPHGGARAQEGGLRGDSSTGEGGCLPA